MEAFRRGQLVVFDVPFVAAIAAGTEVVVLWLTIAHAGWMEASEVSCVLDRGARVLYGDAPLWYALAASESAALPCDDLLAVLGPQWSVKSSFGGTVTCAVVTTKNGGEGNHARTRLYLTVEQPAAGYR